MVDSANADLVRAVGALRPYLPDLVLVGGCAHRLFRFHPWADPGEFQPLTTEDTDLLAPLRLKRRERRLHELLIDAGFEVRLSGEIPPTTKYYPIHGKSGFHVEFIADRPGSATKRDGSPDVAAVVSGVTVPKLPYVSLLNLDPWTLDLTPERGFPIEGDTVALRVANPVSYLAQKVLVFSRGDRSREKQAKDVLYIHDTLLLMSARLGDMESAWGALCQNVHPKWVGDLRSLRDAEFAKVTDRLRRAAIIAQASGRSDPPDADRIREVCRLGLGRVFR